MRKTILLAALGLALFSCSSSSNGNLSTNTSSSFLTLGEKEILTIYSTDETIQLSHTFFGNVLLEMNGVYETYRMSTHPYHYCQITYGYEGGFFKANVTFDFESIDKLHSENAVYDYNGMKVAISDGYLIKSSSEYSNESYIFNGNISFQVKD